MTFRTNTVVVDAQTERADIHTSYCVKDAVGRVHAEGTIPALRCDLDR
jgi:hypothetical protein